MTDLIYLPIHMDLIYDVGLHVGEDTDFYLRKGFRVIALEANPELAARCRDRFASSLASGQLVILEGAVVDPNTLAEGQTTISFYMQPGSTLAGSIHEEWAGCAAGEKEPSIRFEVSVVDFAAVLMKYGIPYYLKIDIEGSDLVCLDSLRQFRHRPEYVSIESSRESFGSIQREIELLTSLGYDRFQAIEQSRLPQVQTPPSPPREGKFVDQQFQPGSSGLFGRELDGRWKSPRGILQSYRYIWIGHYLLGRDGIMYRWRFRGASRARRLMKWVLARVTGGAVPGWYDTHARHRSSHIG